MLAERTVVGTLRARCAEVDAASAQLRLEAQLRSASLRPRGLPASALLCVRSLQDPLPGTIRMDGMQVRPPAEWERAAEDALDQALRGAARPALGPVPAGAEAVLFADRAELLACLARDSLDGTAWTRWWWAAVIGSGGSGVEPVAAAWLAEPAYVPAAFALLARTGDAAQYARSLRAPDALELAVRVARVFATPELLRALVEAAPVAGPAKAALEPRRPPPVPSGPPARAPREPPPAAAWIAVVPEAEAPGLSIEQEVVLAIALTLRRAPAVAREPPFAQAVARAIRLGTTRPLAVWTEPLSDDWDVPEETAGKDRLRPRRSAGAGEVAQVATQRAGDVQALLPATPAKSLESGTAPEAEPSPAERPPAAESPARAAVGRPALPQLALEHTPAPLASPLHAQRAPVDAPAEPPAPVTRRKVRPRPRRPDPAPAPTPVADEQPLPRIGIETELGGLFFLLNVGLSLGLYGDFTTPDKPGIALDPWDFVALLGARLLGSDAAIRDDAVWPLLAGLAGRRSNERPGRSFKPPSDWRIPADWLEPFEPEGEWLWSRAGGTLRIVHPAGFPVVAVGLRGREAQALARRELRRYGVRPLLRRASLPPESRVPIRRWVDRLATYAAARIQVALGDPDRAHTVDTVLRRSATVFTTEAHVDVALSLSALAIEIRFAGLDRDPGWIPAAGRFVAFHFE